LEQSRAVADVQDVLEALKIALALVDEGRLPYAAANEFCKRLINQALYERIIVGSVDELTTPKASFRPYLPS